MFSGIWTLLQITPIFNFIFTFVKMPSIELLDMLFSQKIYFYSQKWVLFKICSRSFCFQRNVFKDPKTDPGKKSKKGRLTLELQNNKYVTVQEGKGHPDKVRSHFGSGKICYKGTVHHWLLTYLVYFPLHFYIFKGFYVLKFILNILDFFSNLYLYLYCVP